MYNVSARLLENYVPFISGESPLISEGSFTVTPILAILLVVGGALVLVFLIISTYLCVRKQADSVRRYAHWGPNFKIYGVYDGRIAKLVEMR